MDDYDAMHWQELKTRVEERGGRYEGKPQAIAFLKGNATEATEPAPEAEAAKLESTTMMPAFDDGKPYGTVSGDVEEAPGARFFQGGHYFNAQGEKVG